LTISGVEWKSHAETAGFKQGDLICAIESSPTRYMPLTQAQKRIFNTNNDSIIITVEREIVLMRKGED